MSRRFEIGKRKGEGETVRVALWIERPLLARLDEMLADPVRSTKDATTRTYGSRSFLINELLRLWIRAEEKRLDAVIKNLAKEISANDRPE